MRLLIEIDEERHRIELHRFHENATLGELIADACGRQLSDAESILVDDRPFAPGTKLAEITLLEGSRIATAPHERPGMVRSWSATVSGGLDAGRTILLPRNRPLTAGRSPHADVTLASESASWDHLTVTLRDKEIIIEDRGSTNGTFLDGKRVEEEPVSTEEAAVVTAGGTTILLRPLIDEAPAPAPGTLHNLTPAATAPFNRPPRPGLPEPIEPLTPPARKDIPSSTRFSFITILAPLVLAFAMVLILGDARYALFAALSPVMGVGSWFEQKHRRARSLKEEETRFTQALTAFEEEIATAAQQEKARHRIRIPDPATVIRRAEIPATTMWQQRGDAPDFLALHAGIADIPWQPPVDTRSGSKLDEEVREILDRTRMPAAPVEIDLARAGVVGIVGDREGALALARSLLCQAAVHCGPADLTIGIFCDPGRDNDWGWAGWLPHTRLLGADGNECWMSDNRERSDHLLRQLRDSLASLPTHELLLVFDSDVLMEGRQSIARDLLGTGRSDEGPLLAGRERPRRVPGIVIASAEEQLPATCTIVMRVGADAEATLEQPETLTRIPDVVIAGVSIATAERCAMALARFDDPELAAVGAALPSLVRLPPLLGMQRVTPNEIRDAWSNAKGVAAPIGVGEAGALVLDLVKDGPHGLVGGTTGSGKSEFLRSLVAGLAARNDPTRLSFILIDFKGGAAFATCERLPHTIGTISNLDEQLADRALRALEAEMQRRQRVFAAAGEGIDNLDAYLATKPPEPMPRLLLVVDEFAMLAKEYPDVLSSLVSVAAVGRTLGVHMILATQRPAGVVNDDILANTNLRVALRVQSRDDSNNVIGVPDASAIGRGQTGRAYVKRGQDDIVPVQTALVTGRAEQDRAEGIELLPVTFSGTRPVTGPIGIVHESAPSDLDELIESVCIANEEIGFAAPRPVWPEPLGERAELIGFEDVGTERNPVRPPLPSAGGFQDEVIAVGVADDPDRQLQFPAGWDLQRGNLLLMGIPGSGTSTTLASIALSLTLDVPPDELDLLILDAGARDLAPLAELPHTVAYVGTGAGGKEQQARFLRYLRTELERRRASSGQLRRTVVFIDGLASIRDEFQDYEGQQLLDGLYRAYAEGPELGLWFAVSTTRSKAIPSAIDEVTTQKWLFRLADPYDYSAAGIRPKEAPAAVPGRCVIASSKLQAHIATPAVPLGEAVSTVTARWAGAERKRSVVGRLPDDISLPELNAAAVVHSEPWRIPVGIAEEDLEPAYLESYEDEHILIAGPARSGKSTLLLAIAQSLRAAEAPENPVAIWGICSKRSPLQAAQLDRLAINSADIPGMIADARMQRSTLVILIDDAESLEDPDQSLNNLIAQCPPRVRIIAAGRSADIRQQYGGWTKLLRRGRCGVLLQPDVDFDGEMLAANLPRRSPVPLTTGRGYACAGGVARLVQTMSPGTG